ncbi:MAG TPA: toll/interleukin-1 receptor domain-containing protein [Pseudonocardiaceae bacterium]|nr:toll/interleukin-1 receptor domain-containing protein [Pseudonocardiaceae bacterium]
MALVFVSYRTGDAAHVAAAVHERLVAAFGPGQVFRDARSMGPGERYPSTIRSALRRADVVVAVIGHQWLAANEHGQRLVDREWDWVRWEITTAVEFGIPIVPVLVDDTPLPDAAALPGRMAELARFQVARVRHTDQGPDLDRLAAALVERVPALTQSRTPVPIPSTGPRSRMPARLGVRGRALGISIALVVALAGTGRHCRSGFYGGPELGGPSGVRDDPELFEFRHWPACGPALPPVALS